MTGCYKIAFASAHEAYKSKDNVRGKQKGFHGVEAYRCPFCNKFHLGHPPKYTALPKSMRGIRGAST